MDQRSLGFLLRAAREAKGLSVEELARALNWPAGGFVTALYLEHFENGAMPPADDLRRIAAALDLPPHTFALAHFRATWGELAEVALSSGAWRETAKELPPVGERVLGLFAPSDLRTTTHHVVKFHGPDNYGWEWSSPGLAFSLDEVSHWMPLPVAPSAADPTGGAPDASN